MEVLLLLLLATPTREREGEGETECLQATEGQMQENAWMEFEYWKDGGRYELEIIQDSQKFHETAKPIYVFSSLTFSLTIWTMA